MQDALPSAHTQSSRFAGYKGHLVIWRYAFLLAYAISCSCLYRILHGSQPRSTENLEKTSPEFTQTYPAKSSKLLKRLKKSHFISGARPAVIQGPLYGWHRHLWVPDWMFIPFEATQRTQHMDRLLITFSNTCRTFLWHNLPKMPRLRMRSVFTLLITWKYPFFNSYGSWCSSRYYTSQVH